VISLNNNARHSAFLVLKRVFGEKTYLNIALKNIDRKSLSEKDISFITRLTNTVLENLGQIDYALKPLIEGKRVHSSIRTILRMSVCEILFMSTPDRAAVNEAVNLTVRIGKESLKGFVNAVLRNFSDIKEKTEYPDIEKQPKEYFEVFSGYKPWFIDEVIEDYGMEFAKDFLLYKQKYPDYTHIRINTLKISVEDIQKHIDDEGFGTREDEIFADGLYIKKFTDIENREIFKNGQISVMGKASMVCVSLASPKEGMSVIDACAAPGGKTAYMSSLMQNKGNITAFDIHPHRVELTRKNMKRLGCENVFVSVKDASEYDESLKEKFDLVFLDMPCSSMGLAYKKADIRLFKEKADVENLAAAQKKILNAAKNYVKRGGILMYMICSITREESDLKWFFKKNKNFTEEKLDIPKNVEYFKAEHGIKLFPNISNMDGFYICKMRKN